MAEISAGVDIDDCCRISAADFMQIPQGAANREGRPEEVQETPEVDSRQVMFKEVKELQAEGLNIAQISKKLDSARQTIRKYMVHDTIPKRAGKER